MSRPPLRPIRTIGRVEGGDVIANMEFIRWIEGLNRDFTATETEVGDLDLTGINSTLASHTASISSLNTTVSGHTTAISDNADDIDTNATAIAGLPSIYAQLGAANSFGAFTQTFAGRVDANAAASTAVKFERSAESAGYGLGVASGGGFWISEWDGAGSFVQTFADITARGTTTAPNAYTLMKRENGDARYLQSSAGASGSFTTTDGKTVTVANGQITSIV